MVPDGGLQIRLNQRPQELGRPEPATAGTNFTKPRSAFWAQYLIKVAPFPPRAPLLPLSTSLDLRPNEKTLTLNSYSPRIQPARRGCVIKGRESRNLWAQSEQSTP